MINATRTTLRRLTSLPGGGFKWCTGMDLGSSSRHTRPLSAAPWGAAPLDLIPALHGGLRGVMGAGPSESSAQLPGKGQQLRFYRAGRVSRSIEQQKPEPKKAAPQLMDFPWVVWPSVWHTIRNWVFANILIYRYLDKEFELASFKKGAIQALVYVSHELSKGNFEALEHLVTKPSLEEIKRNYTNFSLKQRLDLAVEPEDIFFSFPYQIGVIFTNEGGPHERIFVEITMCYHIFRGFQDYVTSAAAGESAGGLRGVYDKHDRISVANYRFIREYTRGVVDDWTITLANHFKPGDTLQRQ